MTTYTVGLNSDYTSISNALVKAVAGDTIELAPGYGPETATVGTNNLTFSGEASSVGIILKLSADVALFQLSGDAPIEVQDGPGGNGIIGNLGANLITVSQGADAVNGGAGTDRLVVDYGDSTNAITGDSTSSFAEANTGRMVTVTGGTIESFTVRTGTGADTITTDSGNDDIVLGSGANTATAGDGDNTVTGGDDVDTITTGNGNDYVAAGAGKNTVTTNAGNDTVLSGSGEDTIVVGAGNDEVSVTGGSDTVDAGAGEDRLIVNYSASTTGIVTAALVGNGFTGYSGSFAAGATDVVGFSGVEQFQVTGGTGNDDITTGDGSDQLNGGAGNDNLTGRGGNDRFTGGSGDDFLQGGDGIDSASYSGKSSDYFVYQENGLTYVQDLRLDSPDGLDSLLSVEQLLYNTPPAGTVFISGKATEDQVLTASNNLTDADGIGTVGYQWLADGAVIAGANTASFTLAQGQVGKVITVVASYTDAQGAAESVSSAPTPAVANVNDAPTGAVTISGTKAEDQILTATNTLVDEDGLGTVTYQWLADGAAIVGANTATFTLTQGQVGKSITVAASYTDAQGTPESVLSAATVAVANVNDALTGTVTISGTEAEDQILTATNTLADEDGLGTVSYQWLAGGAAIAGATNATLTLAQGQVGKTITVVASYTDGQGTPESTTSAATGVVTNVNDAPTGAVTITGMAAEDQTLTAANSLVDEDGLGTVSYQWLRGGEVITGATSGSYTPTQADVSSTISVRASYIDNQGKAESLTSMVTAAVANVNDAPTGTVTISGTKTEDQILTATNTLADEDGLGTVSYQWLAGGAAIVGATDDTITLTQAEVGKAITVVASYTDLQGTDEAQSSAATVAVSNVPDAPTGSVVIAGEVREGNTLTASNTLADEDGLGAIQYQWYANDALIPNATGGSFTLTDAQVGTEITVRASYVDGQGDDEEVSSVPTSAVQNVNVEPAGSVVITGLAREDETLTASNNLADADGIGTISYQWFAGGATIDGATGTELTLSQNEVGRAITVVASYTDQDGSAEAVGSTPSALVSNVNDEPGGEVVISGTAAEDQVLTATNDLTDEDGLGAVTYQWLADGSAIAGATGNTFTLTQSQVGRDITAVAGYVDGQGKTEEVAASPIGPVANVNDAPVGDVTISGTAAEDEVLTASNTLTDEDGLGPVTYQWQADGSSIAGATDANYTLTQGEVGKTISVIASYLDMQGTNEAVASVGTGAVAAGLPSFYFTMTDTGASGQVEAMVYNGPVTYLNYDFAGTGSDEAVVGTAANDFLHLGAGDDAVDGGEGRDVIDGGTGSNFLTGGSGSDVFFLDGRNGEVTWSTITDWQQGEQLSVWGWRDGVSQATFVEDAGAAGYRGVTMHADLNGNGVIDTSVTWSGLTQANLPATTVHDGLLWFA